MKSKVFLAATALSLLTLVMVAASARAAGPLPFNGKPVAAKLLPANLKFRGTIQFRETPSQPLPKNPAVAKKFQQLANKVNRPLPGQGANAKKPANPLAPKGSNTPIVTPTQIGSVPTSRVKSAKGLNAWDNVQANGYDLTPPDQGLCVGNGYIVEPINVVVAIYDTNFKRLSGDMALNAFFGLPSTWFTSDPKCYFDPGTNRFFMTILSIADSQTQFFVNIAVSQTANPSLGWYLYDLETTGACQPVVGDCLADQPLIGANRDGLFISGNMFSFNGLQFFGSDIFMMDKLQLASGSVLVPAYVVPMCEFSGDCNGATPYVIASLQPGFSPTTGAWENRFNGTEYFLAAEDYIGAGASSVLLGAFTNTGTLRGLGVPSVFVTLKDVDTEDYILPYEFAAQKYDGVAPLASAYGADAAGPIQNNDDRMNQVVFVNRLLWSGVNTTVWQRFAGAPPVSPNGQTVVRIGSYNELHSAIAWWAIRPTWTRAGELAGTVVKQDYVAPAHEDAVFPSIGVNSLGKGAMAFTLTGKDYYPTAAWVRVNALDGQSKIFIAAKGKGTLDDFCEYDISCGSGVLRPRFGDYSAAVAGGANIFMATEYVQFPNCSFSAWLDDPSCGGTRSLVVNWGTALYKIAP